MASRKVAEARRTQLVSTYGVGSLFPAQDESFMILGIDDWPAHKCPEVPEPRLARSLGVRTFRMPPSHEGKDLPVVRFPRIQHCGNCERLGRLDVFCGWDEHVCRDCQKSLTPSRFVICCEKGHIDDFPYHRWLHRGAADEGGKHNLRLRTRGRAHRFRMSCCIVRAGSHRAAWVARSGPRRCRV